MGFPQGEPLSSDNIFFAVKTTKKYHKDRGILDFIFSCNVSWIHCVKRKCLVMPGILRLVYVTLIFAGDLIATMLFLLSAKFGDLALLKI